MTQPNFTAECLAARNAGVEFLMLGMDTNSQRRVVASCEQQGYRPVFGLVQARAEMAGDRGIDGAVLVSNVFPFSGVPAAGTAVARLAVITPATSARMAAIAAVSLECVMNSSINGG